jgi:hypothetical protein
MILNMATLSNANGSPGPMGLGLNEVWPRLGQLQQMPRFDVEVAVHQRGGHFFGKDVE